MLRVVRLPLLICCACLTWVAPALAASTTQTLSPGQTIATGSTVSASDPVQMLITAPAGGTFTIQKNPAASRPATSDGFLGSEFVANYTPPARYNESEQQQQITETFLIYGPALPRPGAVRNGFTGKDASVVLCRKVNGPTASCDSPAALGGMLKGAVQPDGNVVVYQTEHVADDLGQWDVGFVSWLVEGAGHGTEPLETALTQGIYLGWTCTQACAQVDTATVTSSVARSLHLRSTEVGHAVISATAKLNGGHIPLTPAFKAAIKHLARITVTVRDVLTGDLGDRTVKTFRVTLEKNAPAG